MELFLPDHMRTPDLPVLSEYPSEYHRCAGVNAIWYRGRRVPGAEAIGFRAIKGSFDLDRSGFWDGLQPVGRQRGRERFDLYVAVHAELEHSHWRRVDEANRWQR